MKTGVTTIIPVLNDDAALRRCLSAVRVCDPLSLQEIIVADGGASEAGGSLAREFGALYMRSEPGRGRQMNRAAQQARGEWLWFLHADCIPAHDALDAILALDAAVSWGCFRHRIDAPSPWLRGIEALDNLRARAWRLPYGDQGIFVRAERFHEAGRYQEVPLLEDVLLARKLAAESAPRVLKPILKTDARRWLAKGILRTTLRNWRIMFEFDLLKKSPEDLAALYHSVK